MGSASAAAGTATVALKGKGALCADEKGQPFSLASYFTTSGSYALQQYLLAADTKSITPTESAIELKVALPNCYRQVDLVWGDEIINPRQGERRVRRPQARLEGRSRQPLGGSAGLVQRRRG